MLTLFLFPLARSVFVCVCVLLVFSFCCWAVGKVADVVETLRPDEKNAQYAQVIKDGDALLSRVQKLTQKIRIA